MHRSRETEYCKCASDSSGVRTQVSVRIPESDPEISGSPRVPPNRPEKHPRRDKIKVMVMYVPDFAVPGDSILRNGLGILFIQSRIQE